MNTSNLIKLDRAGIFGLLDLLVVILHTFAFLEQDFLVGIMVVFMILAVFFGYKDREEKEITFMNHVILFTLIGGILLFAFFSYKFNLFS